jgi:monofunctional biosynthetic peptidoglycan transglycosylase
MRADYPVRKTQKVDASIPELRQALNELRFKFHQALARRLGQRIANDRELRRLIKREPDEERVRRVVSGLTESKHRWIRCTVGLALFVFLSLLLAVVVFRFTGPSITPVMIAEKLSGKAATRNWVSLGNISRELPLAVIAGEDGNFCKHWGVDWGEVWHAINGGGSVRSGLRGASTITMQVAKNLYLWPERSYLRKALEVPIAFSLSVLWPKKVVIETYLNIAPWGPGIVGAEAASQHFFRKSASELDRREAILMAMVLPSPSLRDPSRPTERMLKNLPVMEKRMEILKSRSACVLP